MFLPRRRTLHVLVATLALLLVAGPAWADPAGPTNYRAEVMDITPPSEVITAEVHGGDSYLVLTVAEGHEVVVPGYDGEELYLRFEPDGTVYENQASATYFQNLDRYGAAVPSSAGADAEPEWVQVSSDGTFGWHDHRIHWMSPTPPSQVDTSADEVQPVYDWEIEPPILVDGEEVMITGSLTWYPSPTPIVPILVVILALVAAVVLGSRSVPATAAVGLAGGLAVLAVVLGGRLGLPTGVQAEPALLPPAIIAAAAPAVALLGRNRPAPERLGLTGLGALTAALAVLLQTGAFTRPVVPNVLPSGAVRILLGLALGLALGAIVAVARNWTAPDRTARARE